MSRSQFPDNMNGKTLPPVISICTYMGIEGLQGNLSLALFYTKLLFNLIWCVQIFYRNDGKQLNCQPVISPIS